MHRLAAQPIRLLWLTALLILVIAAACGPAPAAPQPTVVLLATIAPAATASQPTAAPQPTSLPQPAAAPAATASQPTAVPQPTAAPQSDALLPAPLYYIEQDGQIWRMERDGKTRRQITFETFPIVDFDIGVGNNALVYLVNRDGDRQIVRLDESGRREMISGPVSSPRLSPDSEQMAFELNQGVDGMQVGREQGSDTGVYLQGRNGGRPSVLQASDPIADINSPPENARQYYPVAWSPDGAKLLMGMYFPVGEGGLLAVKQLGDGAVVEIKGAFGEAEWSPDGAAIVIAGGTIVQDALLGLWRADPRSGAATALLTPSDSQGTPLITAARQLADGSIYAFLAFTFDPSIENLDKVAPHRLKPDGSLDRLRQDSFLLSGALWADDASGAVIAETTADRRYEAGSLRWLPIAGGPPIDLSARGALPRWGASTARPRGDACDYFSPIAWEPPAARGQRPEVLDAQRRLAALGYAVGTLDGLYGDQTRAAVQEFQRAHGLPDRGDVDCATWARAIALGI